MKTLIIADAHSFLLPPLFSILQEKLPPSKRIFDLGCGNGSVAAALSEKGYELTGVDPSSEGITQANIAYPNLKLEQGSAYDDLAEHYGRFDCVVSIEVVEHVFAPRKYAKTLYDLVDDDGMAIISTPYHGYWKNLALSLSGSMDRHFTALWDGGHIKFWSFVTLEKLLKEVGFKEVSFYRVGRIPPFAKCMIAVAKR